jgi:hypothetical protein
MHIRSGQPQRENARSEAIPNEVHFQIDRAEIPQAVNLRECPAEQHVLSFVSKLADNTKLARKKQVIAFWVRLTECAVARVYGD